MENYAENIGLLTERNLSTEWYFEISPALMSKRMYYIAVWNTRKCLVRGYLTTWYQIIAFSFQIIDVHNDSNEIAQFYMKEY